MTDGPIPYIPETIRVHLGAPSSAAENITVSFRDYIKNVASSEVYPTWEDAALRANILAQISFALNRVYLEYYPSRGYDFDITNSTAYDQKFIKERDIFENVGALVDQLFQSYIRRQGFIEPLSTSFCNGTTVTCSGMSQWGSQSLATQGYSYFEILQYYYGDNIEIVTDVPVRGLSPSYPGSPLRLGSSGVAVLQIQGALNRISQNYPAIPKITPLDGLFGPGTEDAVKKFQEIFNLTADGVVGAATWNQIIAIYVAVTRLAELRSEGQRYLLGSFSLPTVLSLGSSGEQVSALQYMLSTLSSFISEIPEVTIDGQYGLATRDAVLAYQRFAGLTPSGLVGTATWDSIYNRFSGITGTVLDNSSLFPSASTMETIADVQRSLQTVVSAFSAIDPPRITGVLDRNTTRAIGKVQSLLGLKPTGQITSELRRDLDLLSAEQTVRFRQYPGRVLYQGQRDPSSRKAVT
jgi:peptidoglycan hydrolase-like protein with peptidoglycan-binding domain